MKKVDGGFLCPKCKEVKQLEDITVRSSGKLNSYCKGCTAANQQSHREANPDSNKIAMAKHHEKYPESNMGGYLKNKYGITMEEYKALLDSQGGVCKICGKPEKTAGRSLAVDHNHITDEVRGLLCGNCNTALGKFQDDPAILESAINYLKERGDYGQAAR